MAKRFKVNQLGDMFPCAMFANIANGDVANTISQGKVSKGHTVLPMGTNVGNVLLSKFRVGVLLTMHASMTTSPLVTHIRKVLSACTKPQMSRIDASGGIAGVAHTEVVINRTVSPLIGYAVCENSLTEEYQTSVPLCVSFRLPQPTTIGLTDIRPKSFNQKIGYNFHASASNQVLANPRPVLAGAGTSHA